MKILLLSLDRMLAERISEALGGRVAVDLVETLDIGGQDGPRLDGPGVVIVDHAALPPERGLAAWIAMVAEGARGRAIVLATDDMYAAQVLQAIRAGAADVFPRGAERAEIAGVLTRVIRELDAAEVRVDDIGFRRPTLDEVFLTLTGHPAEDAEASEEVAE